MQIHQIAKTLGYAGLIPFVIFSIATWITLPFIDNPYFALITYAAVILSFMGAIHWGFAMSHAGQNASLQLGLSVLPALLGWISLLIPTLYGLSLLVICFSLLCLVDKIASKELSFPSWYVPMRVALTTVVVVCLISAMLASIINYV